MKRRYALFTVVLAVLLLIGIQAVEVVDANPFPPFSQMTVRIHSPSNETYGLPVLVNFSAVSGHVFYLISDIGEGGGDRYSGNFYYTLDGQDMKRNGTMIVNAKMTESTPETDKTLHYFSGTTSLTHLTRGNHSITIYWGVPTGQGVLNSPYCSASAQFIVDPQLTPTPSETAPSTQFLFGVGTDLVLPLAAVGIIVVGVAAGLFVYFKRRKGKP